MDNQIDNDVTIPAVAGMTLRDYFAGQALSNPVLCSGDAMEWQLRAWFGDQFGITREQIASMQARSYANSMLEARKCNE
jgi:hypothetical protein